MSLHHQHIRFITIHPEIHHRHLQMSKANDAPRNSALDFVKGALVVAMVGYHAGTLFISDLSTKEFTLGVLLDFVSGSWVFVSGLLIIWYYREKFEESPRAVSSRLWVRGLKILLLFLSLNAGIYCLGLSPHRTRFFDLHTLTTIVVHGGGTLSSFEVLVGIAYLLLLSPLILYAGRLGPYLVGLTLFGCMVFTTTGNQLSPNVWLVICGLGGVMSGYLWKAKVKMLPIATPSDHIVGLIGALLAACAYYGLKIYFGYKRENLQIYLLGITSLFFSAYLSYMLVDSRSRWNQALQLLGRYSLPCYIGQMALLWLGYSISGAIGPFSFWIMMPATLAGLFIAMSFLDSLRQRNMAANKVYRFVFE